MGRRVFLSVPLRQIKGNRNYFSKALVAVRLKGAFVSFGAESGEKAASEAPFLLPTAQGVTAGAPSPLLALASGTPAQASSPPNQQVRKPQESRGPDKLKDASARLEGADQPVCTAEASTGSSLQLLPQHKRNILGDQQKRGQELHPAFHEHWAVPSASASLLPLGWVVGVTVGGTDPALTAPFSLLCKKPSRTQKIST